MRIAVMGSGAVGGYWGGLLTRAGERVTFIARGDHLDALRDQGLTVQSPITGDFRCAVSATDDPDTIGQVDLVLFCVKTYDLDAAAARLSPLSGPTRWCSHCRTASIAPNACPRSSVPPRC